METFEQVKAKIDKVKSIIEKAQGITTTSTTTIVETTTTSTTTIV